MNECLSNYVELATICKALSFLQHSWPLLMMMFYKNVCYIFAGERIPAFLLITVLMLPTNTAVYTQTNPNCFNKCCIFKLSVRLTFLQCPYVSPYSNIALNNSEVQVCFVHKEIHYMPETLCSNFQSIAYKFHVLGSTENTKLGCEHIL